MYSLTRHQVLLPANLNMNNISESIRLIWDEMPIGVRLVAVSKYHTVEKLMVAYEAGQRGFGESHAQEGTAKSKVMPEDIEWHFIGHLQTNKVKYIAPFVSLIHSVDSLKLLKEIDRQAAKNGRIINCLLQIHIADEETKFGLDETELILLLESDEYDSMRNVRIDGLMCMATNTDDEEKIRNEFRKVREMFDKVKSKYFGSANHFRELSMGMSDDYPIAIQEGSTLIRVGSKIFGSR